MGFWGIVIPIVVAILVALVFYFVLKNTGPWGSFWTFLLILILAGFAAEVWIPPFGPIFRDIAWMPLIFVILLFAILLAAAAPVRSEQETEAVQTDVDSTSATVSAFFWILLLLFVIAIIIGIIV